MKLPSELEKQRCNVYSNPTAANAYDQGFNAGAQAVLTSPEVLALVAAAEDSIKLHPVDQGNCIRDHYPEKECDCYVSKVNSALAAFKEWSIA